MNKKITRRAVLGTTITALAAGPFVMRAMRKGQKGLAVCRKECTFVIPKEHSGDRKYPGSSQISVFQIS